MRASFACAAARSQALHGREVEYITQSDRSSRARRRCASRIASRSAWPAHSPFCRTRLGPQPTISLHLYGLDVGLIPGRSSVRCVYPDDLLVVPPSAESSLAS